MKTVPSYEKPLYEKLQQISQSLLALKNNRNKYISSKQVYSIYDDFLATLHELSLTRKDEELKGITLNLPNACDVLIDDIWSMSSLCFVTCGLTKFAPATYSSLSIVYKLLGHLKSCQVYTMDDLEPIRSRLDEIKKIILLSEELDEDDEDEVRDDQAGDATLGKEISEKAKKESHKKEESLLLRNKWNKCFQVLSELEKSFKEIPEDLGPIYSQLVFIRKQLLNYLTNSPTTSTSSDPNTPKNHLHSIMKKPDSSVVTPKIIELKEELKKIELMRDQDGKFPSSAPQEQQDQSTMVLNGLLDDCNNFINDISLKEDAPDISNLFKNLSIKNGGDGLNTETEPILTDFSENIYSKLLDMKAKLENLLVTRRWTMRETDLYNYSKSLKAIDEERMHKVRGFQEQPSENLTDAAKDSFKKLHMIILYLLRRCYSLIYKLLESSEPVSESLQPIHNQLSTVRRCLLEIKRIDGLNKLKELYPYQFKLASLDNLRQDGKFIVNGTIPEGQGLLNALLAECFDILHELKIELEEKELKQAELDGDDANIASVDADDITDEEDIQTDDEVELKRNRYAGFNEADYDQDSDSCVSSDISDSEYEGNDYY